MSLWWRWSARQTRTGNWGYEVSSQSTFVTKSLREEINELFGVRWDSVIEWAVISWLSVWFWTTYAGPSSEGWKSGPLRGIEDFLRSLDVEPPAWLLATLAWFSDSARQTLLPAFVIIAAVACVTSVRGYHLSGLRTLALVALAIACEINASLYPVAWVLALAAIPASIAMVLGLTADRFRRRSGRYYLSDRIVANYSTRIVMLFLSPVLAPGLLALQLVASFRTDLPYSPAEELATEVALKLEDKWPAPDGERGADELTQVAAAASIHLAGNTSAEARNVASRYLHHLRFRNLGSRPHRGRE
jgi:hypothetical protein